MEGDRVSDNDDNQRKPKPGDSLSGIEKRFVSKRHGGSGCVVAAITGATAAIATAVTAAVTVAALRGWA